MKFEGSTWNKWDLHVHTIYTRLNNHYSCGMKEIAEKIKNEKIRVVGVTNYFIIEEVEILELQAELGNDVKIFPNFEFRINEKNKDNEYINIHIVFNPDSTKISSILQTLSRVQLSNISAQNKYCTVDCLNEFGCESVTVSLNDLLTQLRKDFIESKDFVVVGVNKGYGGFCPSNKPRDLEFAQKMDESSHMFFSSKREDRDFFLNKVSGRSELGLKKKPLFMASDAHQVSKIGADYSWVKAEPTFEGLRQVINEPEGRISLAENKPTDPLRTIKNLKLIFSSATNIIHYEDKRNAGNENLFCLGKNLEMSFSPFFTCVIGGRGSGKSTILNLIAEDAIGATEFFKYNFLRENGKDLTPQDFIEIDGTKDIEFISQNQVEKFANNEELTEAIYDRLKSLSYQEFSSLEERNETNNKEIENQIKNINDEYDLEEKIKELGNNLLDNSKIVDHYNSEKYKELTNAISEATNGKSQIERSKDNYTSLIERLNEIISDFKTEQNKENGYEKAITEIIGSIEKLVLPKSFDEDQKKITEFEGTISKKRHELEIYMKDQGVSEEDSNEYERAVENIPIIKSEIEHRKKELEDTKRKIAKFNSEVQKYEELKADFEKAINDSLSPMNSQLVNIDKNVADIKFEYRFNFQLAENNLLDEFEMHFKEFKPSEHSTRRDAVRDYLFCVKPWDVSDYEDYMAKLENFRGDANAKELVKEIFKKKVNFESYRLLIKKVANDVLIHKKIVGFYDNKEFKRCSFGQKCTAVIVALLMFGNKPIIIDEPEAHLDSKLIAEYLINLIKTRKKNRQIIFATHNANFVINGDAELIHCLEIDEKTNLTKITSTTIEDLGNRERLLALEGGKEAFELRDKKLLN